MSARDRINVKKLLEDTKILDDITQQFCENVDMHDIYIVGIDFVGMKLAALLSTKTHNSFSYLISEKCSVCKCYGKHDKLIKFNQEKDIVLITGVVVTGETINKIIDELCINNGINKKRIRNILTIFKRNPIGLSKELHETEKIEFLNGEIDVQICNIDQCIYKKNNMKFCEIKIV